MNRWTIYSKNGNPKYVAENLEYRDTWMGEEFVTVTIATPAPLALEIGDYLDYRGSRYSIYSVPTTLKQARRNSYGEAFRYESVKFSARSTELTDIRMLDVVLSDNKVHYTGLPTFSFYAETVDDLVDRLLANTDRSGETPWIFVTPNFTRTRDRYGEEDPRRAQAIALYEQTFGSEHVNVVDVKNVNISIDKTDVFATLHFIKDAFGLNYVCRSRSIVVGGEGIAAGHVFEYGKGNGLATIERTADSEQQVVTKLYAYGSDKNLPIRYYADLSYVPFALVKQKSALKGKTATSDGYFMLLLDLYGNEKYFTGWNYIGNMGDIEAHATVGIGTETKLDGYRQLPWVFWHNPESPNNYTEDFGPESRGYVEVWWVDGKQYNQIQEGTRIYFLSGVNMTAFPENRKQPTSAVMPNNMAVNVLMLPGFPKYALSELCLCEYDSTDDKTYFYLRKTTNDAFPDGNDKKQKALLVVDGYHPVSFSDDQYTPYLLSGNASAIGTKEGSVHFTEENDDNGLQEVYPSIEGMTVGDIDGTSSTVRIDEILEADVIDDNGVFVGESAKIPNFHIKLRNLGFDLKGAFNNAGGSMTISMTDGHCGGRDFSVEGVSQNNDGIWTLNVKRQHDEALDLYFPYSTAASSGEQPSATEAYQIQAGDHFVLTGIDINDSSYIWAASVKALRKAILWLLNNDYTRYTYLPKIDEIFMAREAEQQGQTSLHDTLKAGMIVNFRDEDMNVDGSVFIDQLTIKENGNQDIPTYDVVLRNDKQVGTLQRVQNQINSLSSQMSGGGTGDTSKLQRLIEENYLTKTFFNKLFKVHVGNDTDGTNVLSPNREFDPNSDYSIEAMFGFWTEKYISALGKNDSGSGGGGGAVTLEDLTDVEISSPAVGQVLKLRQNPTTGLYEWYNGSDEGVTSIDWSNITNKPSTFTPSAHNHDERYYINNGTIYLGGLSITPVTSLEGYATESYVNNNFLSTIGGSLNGDLTLNNASLIQQYMINPSDPEYAYLTIEDGIITLDSDGKIQTRDESYYFDNNGNAVFATLKVGVNDVWHADNHPTTLGGYGITDAKIENGVITLGSNTIMPVTSVAMTMPTGLSVTGSPITKTGTFAVSYASGYEGFTTAWKNDIYDKVYAIFSWFEVDANGDIKTKDKPNNGGHRGFYSESFVSALGKNDASGSGGLDIDAMWSELMNIDNTKVIDISHIPTIPTSKINNLIGYITDCLTDYASIAGNTIYIGEDSLNLNNYLPLIGGGMDGNIYWQYSGRRTTRLEIGQHTLSTTADYDYYLSAMAGGGLSPLFGVRTDGTVEAVRYIIGSDLTIDNEYIAYHYENAAGTIEKDANISLEYGFHYESKNGATTKYTNIIDDHITLSSGSHAVNIISTGMTIDGNAVRHAGDTYYSGGSLVVGGVTVPLSSGDYLLKSGDTMTGNLTMGTNSVVFNTSTSSTWNVGQNTGLMILNTVGQTSTGAPDDHQGKYHVGLSICGYYGFQIAVYGGTNEGGLLYRKIGDGRNYSGSGDFSWKELANKSDLSSYLPLTGGGVITSGDYSLGVSENKLEFKYNNTVYGSISLDYGIDGAEFDISSNATLGGETIATQAWVGQQGYLTSSALSNYLNKNNGGTIYGDIALSGVKLTQSYAFGDSSDPEYGTLSIEDGIITLDNGGKIQSTDESYYFDAAGNAELYSLTINGETAATRVWVGNQGYVNSNDVSTALRNYASITNGTIRIGDTSITPLTSLPAHNHEIQNLTNFATYVYDATQSRIRNTVLAAPNGSNGVATFRSLVTADISNLSGYISDQLTDYASIAGSTIYIGEDSISLGSYLPLSAGSGKALTGDLYMGANALNMRITANNETYGAYLHYNGLQLIGLPERLSDGTSYTPVTTVKAGSITTNGNITVGANSIIFNQATSSTWNVGRNSGLKILNTVGASSEGAPTGSVGQYQVGLSVSGYYGFQLSVYGGAASTERLKFRKIYSGTDYTSADYDTSWHDLAYLSDIPNMSGYATTSMLNNYLPLNGGGIITSGDYSLVVSENTLSFMYNDTEYGRISLGYGVDGAEFDISSNATLGGETIATQAWVGEQGFLTSTVLNGYLPLSGGTMTGVIRMNTNAIKLGYSGSGSSEQINMMNAILNNQSLTFNNNTVVEYGQPKPKTTIEAGTITTTGSITVNGNAVWHAGNLTPHSHSNKSVLDGITSTKVNNWDAAYSWGNHASAGYLKGYNSGTGISIESGYVNINSTYQAYISHGESAYNSLSNYLLKNGGTMTGNLTMGTNSVVFNTSTSSTWNVGQNTGLMILNTVGQSSAGAPGDYHVGLSVCGYYGFQLASYGGNGERLRYRNIGSGDYTEASHDFSWKEIAFLSDIPNMSGYATTSMLNNYLPLNGGGIITSGDYSLVVSEKALSFKYNNTEYGRISLDYGIDGAEFDISSNATLGGEAIATQSWVGQQGFLTSTVLNGYLPLSGGTMTGAIRMNANAIKLGYSGSGSSEQANAMNAILNNQSLTFNNNTVVEYGQPKPKTTIEAGTIATTGSITVNGNTVWHAGNLTPHSHSNKSVLDGITSTKVNNWDAAYGWGNHASAGYLKGYNSGTGITIASGYVSISDAYVTKIANGEAAYNSLSNYLPLTGGTLTGNLTMGTNSVVFNQATSPTWNVGRNSGLKILNTVGQSSEGAPGNYYIGLSISGYYGFQLSAHPRIGKLLFRKIGDGNYSDSTYDFSWHELAYMSDIPNMSDYATTSMLNNYLPLIGGNISGTLNVKGAGTAFTVDNNTELSGTLYVDGITTLNDNLNVDDDITITSLEKGIVFYSGNYIKTNTSNWLVVNGGDDIHFNIGGETMMFVDDTGTYADSYHNISDIRKKDVVRYDALPDFDDVWRAPAIAFRWKEKMDGGVHLGSVAQYWETILPETVHEDKNGYLSMQYDVIALLAAIVTARKVQNHEERIAELEHENEILRNEVEQLKAA